MKEQNHLPFSWLKVRPVRQLQTAMVLFGFSLWIWLILPARAAPNAPTITSLEGQVTVPGVTTYLNITTNITVTGNAEANKTIKIFDGAVQIGTTASNAAGAYTLDINQATGSHSLTAVANDVSGDSSPSTPATLVIDTTAPGVSIRMQMDNGYDHTYKNYFHTSGWAALRSGGAMQCLLSDAGGSGFDIASATMTLNEIDDGGTVLSVIAGSATQVNSSTVMFSLNAPFAASQYESVLVNAKRYRLTATADDFAGNQKTVTKDFVIDNIMSSTLPGNTHFKTWWIFDADDATVTNPPLMAKLVPMIWVAGNGRWEIDPTFVNATLVDTSTAPHSVKFNRLGMYGVLWAGDVANPPPLQGYNAAAEVIDFETSWNAPVGVTYLLPGAPDANGYNNTFFTRSVKRRLNGLDNSYLYAEDAPRNAENSPYQVNINSSNPISAVTTITAFNAANNYKIGDSLTRPSTTGQIALNTTNVTVRRNETLNNRTIGYVIVKPSGQAYSNTAGVYDEGDSFMDQNSNQVWDAGEPFLDNNTKPAVSDGRSFRIDNVLNVSFDTSGSVHVDYDAWTAAASWGPTYVGDYIYRIDQIAPIITATQPDGTYYQTSGNVGTITVDIDSRPYGSLDTWTGIQSDPNSKVEVLDFTSTVVSAGATAISMVSGDRRYWTAKLDISTSNYPEGAYTIRSNIRDTAPNLTTNTSYKFYVDKTAPSAANIVPGNGTVSSIPSFNADIVDPNLINAVAGTPGSGTNLDLSKNQIDPYKRLGMGNAAATNSLTVPIETPVGGQAIDHRGNVLPLGTTVQVWDTATNEIIGLVVVGNSTASNATLAVNSGGNITVNMTAGALTIGTHYTVFYQLPHFDSNDGAQKIAAVPTLPAIAPGMYAARITGLDKVGNSGTTISLTGIQMDPPTGTITLTPTPATVYILNTAPNERSQLDSSVIQGLSGTIVPDGTLVTITLTGSSGSIVEPDANGVAADGFQIATAANGAAAGRIRFHLKAVDTVTFGTMTVNVSIGSATGTADVVMARPKVAISKAADVTTRTPGQVITYTITYTNSGNSVSNNTTIKDRLPNTVTYVAGSTKLNGVVQADGTVFNAGSGPSGEITVNAGSIAASGTGTVVYQATVK